MTLAMTRKVVRQHADEDTPRRVSVPDSWPGIFMWALGRHGPIVLFVVSTWFLYQDNKVNQAQMLEVAKAQIAVNAQVVGQLTELKISIAAMVEEAKRAHVSTQQR
jgi:hypothetical protein